MRSKILSALLLTVMLLSACSPAATTPVTTEPAPIETTNPTSVPVERTDPPASMPAQTLTVFAAASLTESFTEMGKIFEAQNPGVTISFNFGGSQQLAEQLNQGAEADVFASASNKYMDSAVNSSRVVQSNVMTFVSNRLVVIYPKANPAGVTDLIDLAKPGLKLDLADKSVPVGQYSLDFLDKAVMATDNFSTGYKDAVLQNVVSYETDVKSVVSKVALGEADAGIVYITDYNVEADQLGKLDIPDELNSIAWYPIAAISDSKNPDLAKAFVDLVLSTEGQDLLSNYGFIPGDTGSK